MSENNEGEEISRKGNDWEVVALTESAYAAAPGPRNILDNSDSNLGGDDDSETARAMFMSGHFGLSPSVHENFPLESEYKEKNSELGLDDDVHHVKEQQGSKSDLKDGNLNIEGFISDELSGILKSDEKYNSMSFFTDLGDVESSKSIDTEQGLYGTGKSYDDEDVAAGMPFIADECTGIAEALKSLDDEVSPCVPKHAEEDKFSEPTNLPCDDWWKRRAASLYDHAKSANPYWSLVVAAAVIGLVIVGRRWQRDRPQVFHLKSQLTLDNKGSHWIHSPMERLKDVTLGSRHISYIGLSSLTEG